MFSVVEYLPGESSRRKNHVYLQTDDWDDWRKFRTMFTVYVVDDSGFLHEPGSIRIGEVGLRPSSRTEKVRAGYRAPSLDSEFYELDKTHFSLAQREYFYEALNRLSPDFKIQILLGLRDCAYDLSVFEEHLDEVVMQESLLRDISERNVRNRLHRVARGDAVLTKFEFEFALDGRGNAKPPVLDFKVVPESEPPTNVHVLIGRNGVGKSRAVQSLAVAVLDTDAEGVPRGDLRITGDNEDEWTFSGLVLASFSAFDQFDLPRKWKSKCRADYIGLRAQGDDGTVKVKTPEMLAVDFANSFGACRGGPRAEWWGAAILTLEDDPLFREEDVSSLLESSEQRWRESAIRLFRRLSSGHAIVLLTTTRLVELVDEKTLVILDEPEGHLHPPLLAAFIRSVADLMVKRNGVCLIATHSPVVLQEVPKSCVWKLGRAGDVVKAERLPRETFGENVGVLTREVFGLEVTESGFHSLLRKALEESEYDYDAAVHHFSGQLGSEARAILMALAAVQGQEDEDEEAL